MTEKLITPPQWDDVALEFTDSAAEAVSRNPALQHLFESRRVLLLQGPVGPFFDRLARWLVAGGSEVRRVAFQAGDEHDCRALSPIRFQGTPGEWPAFFAQLVADWEPDCLVLFGQSRSYHKVALERARAIDLPAVVMEEGYFRPGFVTMELGGVNGYSKTLDRFESSAPGTELGVPIAPDCSPWHFQKMAWHASQHYVAMRKGRLGYPHYIHHRNDDPWFYARYWLKSWWRKALRSRADRRFQKELFDSGDDYFFVPLQVEGDSQITLHSPYPSNSEFIFEVMRSFARHAPEAARLVFREHPHARGGRMQEGLIKEISRGLSLCTRVHYLTEGDTPDLAEHSKGVVLINSTVGLQALERGAPLMVLGESFYKRPELTFTGSLDAFWTSSAAPDPVAAQKFLTRLKLLTQAPASVYAMQDELLNWPTSGNS